MDTEKLRSLTILQAEDDPGDVFLLQRAFRLEQVPNPLQTVRDGEEALAYLTGEGQFADRARYPLPCLAQDHKGQPPAQARAVCVSRIVK